MVGVSSSTTKTYEIRDPIHGFICIDDWEKQIIDSKPFQRLRRIWQLAWTNMVYPGAVHTRFEHSLGVMHVATQMFDAIIKKASRFLLSELDYNEAGISRMRALVRLTSLLHDVGHAPFSHAGETLMEVRPETEKPYKHEHYSVYIIRHLMKTVIENHPVNQQNYKITADEVADLLEGNPSLGPHLFWMNLISGQVDADRVDYLLRDSHHIGVQYGIFDLQRFLVTLTAAINPDTDEPTIAIEEGGFHVAESMVMARYQMFTQVYFQHTRRAFDCHAEKAVQELLLKEQKQVGAKQTGKFPPPVNQENVQKYMAWDDWKVLGELQAGEGGEHGRLIIERKHDSCIFHTPEVPLHKDLEKVQCIVENLGDMVSFMDEAEKSWYATGDDDVPIVCGVDRAHEKVERLSKLSNVVAGLKPIKQKRIYVARKNKDKALIRIEKLL